MGGAAEKEIGLDLPAGLMAMETAVTVRLRTEARSTRRFGPLPVELMPEPGDRLLWVQPDSAIVRISGAASIVDRIRTPSIRLLAAVGGYEGGKSQSMPIEAVVRGIPPGTPVEIDCEPRHATIRLD